MAYLQPISRRRRAIALALTVAVHILIALMLFSLAPERFRRMSSDALTTFDVAPDRGEEPTPAQQRQPEQRKQPERKARPAPPRPVPPPDAPIPDYLRMSRDQFAATDISRLPHTAERGTDTSTETASAADSKASYGPGAGPGGARLFNAEWVREPTDAELRTYLPPVPAGSWGEVACRTIPDNRVENCQLIGESPVGSRLAIGIRRAAWQFRVRPPRLGGKAMVGEWVRIRIDITERGVEARR